MKLEEEINKIKQQNRQIIFLLNLLISESKFAITNFDDEEDDDAFYELDAYPNSMYNHPLDATELAKALKSYASRSIPQTVLNLITNERI